jgi:hypothetical protein
MNSRLLTPLVLTALALMFVAVIFAVLFDDILFHAVGDRATTIKQAQENILYNAPTKTPQGSLPVSDPDDTREYVLVRTDKYEIVYQELYNLYIIAILKQPLEETRAEAEQEFLRLLNTDIGVACRLAVHVVVPAYVDQAAAGQALPLSGC